MATASAFSASLALSIAAFISAAQAQQADAAALTIELNALQPSEGGCRLSFVATNGLEADIGKVAYEMVLFDAAGLVERMTVLDLNDVPAGKTRVRQFELAGADCAGISRVLVNDAKACEGPGLEPAACIRGLKTTSKTDVPFSG
jgi:uncharacterized protein (DUF2141 family)